MADNDLLTARLAIQSIIDRKVHEVDYITEDPYVIFLGIGEHTRYVRRIDYDNSVRSNLPMPYLREYQVALCGVSRLVERETGKVVFVTDSEYSPDDWGFNNGRPFQHLQLIPVVLGAKVEFVKATSQEIVLGLSTGYDLNLDLVNTPNYHEVLFELYGVEVWAWAEEKMTSFDGIRCKTTGLGPADVDQIFQPVVIVDE